MNRAGGFAQSLPKGSLPEGKSVYNVENALESLTLFREWREATKSE